MKEASRKLKKKLNYYCVSVRRKISVRQKKRNSTRFYSTVCVGVEDSSQRIQICSHSFEIDSRYVFHQDLKNRLNKIGKIGIAKKGGCVLGYCAEPHAANALLVRLNRHNKPRWVTINTSRFIFTKALRVRTHQIVDYCSFCKQTFPQL